MARPGELRVIHAGAQSVLLRSKHAVAELSVLAPEVFRLRIKRGGEFDPLPSFAVAKTDWPAVAARVETRGQRISLRTSAGALRFDLRTALWELRDARGHVAFAARELSFAGDETRLALALKQNESFHALGEGVGPLDQRGRAREFWNLDVLGHASCVHPSLRGLYVSIPFALSLRDGRAAGIFCDNPARQTWDLGHTDRERAQLTTAGGALDLYFFPGPEVARVIERYTELTGRTPLPPRWALGYHQCRFGYTSRAEIEHVARELRRRRIPCDVLWLDIDHMDGHRVFTFGKSFPRPRDMLAKLKRQGFHVVAIANPGVKNDAKFGVLRRGRARDAFVKTADGKHDFIGKVWPGKCRFPDFLDARVRGWWAREQAKFMRLGLAGIWCDMNEPALFDTPGKTFPDDCVHRFSVTAVCDRRNGERKKSALTERRYRHAAVHNLYGHAMAAAAREGALLAAPDERPFVLTRAGYAGIQRHAAVWTGDNSSTWQHLADSVPMLLNLSLSGVAFCGADAGGFLDSPTPELFVRWMQLAALTPFFRNHSNKEALPQEPWAFGPEAERICKKFIALRYRLLPKLEKLFAETHATGAPVMRPLLYHFQNDPVAVACNDQFLLGADLLVAPVLQPGVTARCVYLPRGTWRDFWSRRVFRGPRHIVAPAPLERIPLFVRAVRR
ncbi:MAG: DUF4968 domain-containing protein [Verrucomicrobia bacterium]|nr:DUF4968 domain-containing protein [Verrucomicrobiota bacterium]